MGRYFLNLRRGPGEDMLTVDPEGDEIEDESLLRDFVIQVARKVMRTRSHRVRDWMTCSFEVLDAQRNLVATIPFTETAGEHEV